MQRNVSLLPGKAFG